MPALGPKRKISKCAPAHEYVLTTGPCLKPSSFTLLLVKLQIPSSKGVAPTRIPYKMGGPKHNMNKNLDGISHVAQGGGGGGGPFYAGDLRRPLEAPGDT